MSTDEYISGELEVLSRARRYQNWIAEQFLPYIRGCTIELGAGIGTMSKRWVDIAAPLHVLEPAPNLFPLLRKNLCDHDGIRFHQCTVENFFKDQRQPRLQIFDTIIMVNVLEHIEEDATIFVDLYRALKPGGHLLIFVPALPWLFGSLDRLFGHFRRYTKTRLAQLSLQQGFRVLKLHYFDMFGVVPWWLVDRVSRRPAFRPGMIEIYDRIVVPTARTVEHLISPPFGKNLVLVARRAESDL